MDLFDQIDEVNAVAEKNTREYFEIAANSQELKRTGFCHWCDEPVEGLFCDLTCSQDYQRSIRK